MNKIIALIFIGCLSPALSNPTGDEHGVSVPELIQMVMMHPAVRAFIQNPNTMVSAMKLKHAVQEMVMNPTMMAAAQNTAQGFVHNVQPALAQVKGTVEGIVADPQLKAVVQQSVMELISKPEVQGAMNNMKAAVAGAGAAVQMAAMGAKQSFLQQPGVIDTMKEFDGNVATILSDPGLQGAMNDFVTHPQIEGMILAHVGGLVMKYQQDPEFQANVKNHIQENFPEMQMKAEEVKKCPVFQALANSPAAKSLVNIVSQAPGASELCQDPAIKPVVDLLKSMVVEPPKSCATMDRWGRTCQFPFTYEGQTFNACTNIRAGRYWCALSTDNYGNVRQWSFCNPNAACPM